ncbi:MAG: AbrB/MazE/SpoVT family DNA-binding domain-containing protein [Candidatus Aminicenantes bacterium]|nr:AbrB/MazE/SpoVT family DNA-binding domain-containing protein [Candidatus Aminicenantes bacterium]
MLCKRTVKNQITLPKKIMDKFDECEYFEVKAEVDRIILIPVKLVSLKENPLTAVRQKIFSLGLSERDISDAIKWARSRK